jgi:uncharacterized membrane protein (UPF0127 family)
VFHSRSRRRRRVVEFVDLVIGDALQVPAVALAHSRPRRSERTTAVRSARGDVVCERCTMADAPLPRMRGLLGRRELSSDEGVLLRPAGSVHTFFMRFAIDVVFLDRDGRVVRVAESVPPWRTAAARGARAVLELRAGESARRRISVGDLLVVGEAA